jgi:glutamate synthase (NADPH/NADH) small chain
MGKPTGFIEHSRAVSEHRSIAERIQDYEEFLDSQDLQQLQTQASRCMDCGISFCHAGILVDGQSIGCPLQNPISETNDLVYRGNFAEAYARLLTTHPFPEFTSRVCPALCEGSCAVGEHGEAVTVKEIERFLSEFAATNGLDALRPAAFASGKKVAIIGSGPAGLAAATTLNQLGHEVTVYERNEAPGGLLMFGIPNMKLSKDVIARRINILQQEGIKFITNTEVGIDLQIEQLQRDYDAVILTCGATQPRLLAVPGANLAGVVPAVSYLTEATRALLASKVASPDKQYKVPTRPGWHADPMLDAAGKDVVIIGGGDTGTDCVATAIRQGAKSVVQIEIMPEAPKTRQSNNPWPTWPKVLKTDYGQEEAIELFKSDPREYLTTVTEVLANEETTGAPAVAAVKTVQVNWVNKGGRLIAEEIAGTEKLRPAQLVLIAMGFLGPQSTLIGSLNLKTDARGNVKTNDGNYRTSLPGVYSAGDMRRGQSLVVWALMEGVNAARECHSDLMAGA